MSISTYIEVFEVIRSSIMSNVAGGWGEYSRDGVTYFYNSITGQSVWERPPEMMAMAPQPPAPTHAGNSSR